MKRAMVLMMSLPLAAHNYPVTHGTLTILPGGARLKLRLSLHHFHPALERFSQKRIALKDDENYEPRLLESYLSSRLVMLTPEGTAVPFSVVKQELDPHDLVLTLEVLSEVVGSCSLKNTVLMETNQHQKNLITVEGLGPRRGLVFDLKTPLQKLNP
jgi:hypothetical protein